MNELSDKNLIYRWYKIKKKSLIIEEEESADLAFKFIKDKYKSINNKHPKIEFEMAGIYKKYEDYESAIQIYNNLLKQGILMITQRQIFSTEEVEVMKD